MWPLSDKIFFEYLGKSVLAHQISTLVAASFTRIHIVGNAENLAKIKVQSAENSLFEKVNFSFSTQENLEEGMLGGILSAEPFLDSNAPMLVVSANDFVEKEFFQKLLLIRKTSNSDIFVCGKKVEKYFPGGYLVVDSENHVQRILEKPGVGNEPSDLINLVLHLFTKPAALFTALQEGRVRKAASHYGYEVSLQKLIDSGSTAEVVPYDGFWQALKYPWHHLSLMEYFLKSLSGQSIAPSSQIASTAKILGAVAIGEGVKIFDYAVIQGPVYLGVNTVVGNHTLIRNSYLGANCVVGHGTEVARSYLRGNIWLHQNYIGDSILDENISFGAGARTANFRLDEGVVSSVMQGEKVSTDLKKFGLVCGKDVRVGINTSLLPGVKVGAGSFLGAGVTVGKDVVENLFVSGSFELQEKPNIFAVAPRKDLI